MKTARLRRDAIERKRQLHVNSKKKELLQRNPNISYEEWQKASYYAHLTPMKERSGRECAPVLEEEKKKKKKKRWRCEARTDAKSSPKPILKSPRARRPHPYYLVYDRKRRGKRTRKKSSFYFVPRSRRLTGSTRVARL